MNTCKDFIYAGSRAITPVLFVLLLFMNINSLVKCIEYRLDTTVLPDVYDITIKPYLLPDDGEKQFTFDGQVNITLHATSADVRNITLHSDYIEILELVLYNESGNLLSNAILGHSIDKQTDKLTVELNIILQTNTNYTLYLRYRGQIRTGLAGFFRASYIKSNGDLK